MSNFRGYYFKIGNCKFDRPAPKRDGGLLILPHLVQTMDAGVLANGKLEIKVLPHTRTKIQVAFPPMKLSDYMEYYRVIMSSMYLKIEYYNAGIDAYETGTFYHTDMQYVPMPLHGEEYVEMQEIHFVEH